MNEPTLTELCLAGVILRSRKVGLTLAPGMEEWAREIARNEERTTAQLWSELQKQREASRT